MPQPTPGVIVTSDDVELAVRDVYREWLEFYAAEIDDQKGLERGTTMVPGPGAMTVASESSARWLELTPPALVVACPGTAEVEPPHGPRAAYGAWWQVSIGITAGGATEEGSRAIAGRLAGAARAVAVQQRDMGGVAETTRWLGERTDVVSRDRKLVAAEVSLLVYVAQVIGTRGLIPRAVPDDPTQPADPTPTPSGTRVRVQPVIPS